MDCDNNIVITWKNFALLRKYLLMYLKEQCERTQKQVWQKVNN